jgi:hypothetical protein
MTNRECVLERLSNNIEGLAELIVIESIFDYNVEYSDEDIRQTIEWLEKEVEINEKTS